MHVCVCVHINVCVSECGPEAENEVFSDVTLVPGPLVLMSLVGSDIIGVIHISPATYKGKECFCHI